MCECESSSNTTRQNHQQENRKHNKEENRKKLLLLSSLTFKCWCCSMLSICFQKFLNMFMNINVQISAVMWMLQASKDKKWQLWKNQNIMKWCKLQGLIKQMAHKQEWGTNRKQSFNKRIGPCIDFCILCKSHIYIYICLKSSFCIGEILPKQKNKNFKLKKEMILEGFIHSKWGRNLVKIVRSLYLV